MIRCVELHEPTAVAALVDEQLTAVHDPLAHGGRRARGSTGVAR